MSLTQISSRNLFDRCLIAIVQGLGALPIAQFIRSGAVAHPAYRHALERQRAATALPYGLVVAVDQAILAMSKLKAKSAG